MSRYIIFIKLIYISCTFYICILLINKNKTFRRTKDIFKYNKVIIESHRGVNKEFFQNTIESFSKAIEYGIDSIETDVWLTKDNVLVLVHGSSILGSLNGYYDHPGDVIDLTWDELSTYRTIQDNLTMPRLSDLMEIAKNKIFINLEIKDYRIDLVFPYIIQLIDKYNFYDQITLCSPFYQYYNRIKEFNKHNYNKLIFGFVYDKNILTGFDYTKKGSILNIHWADATKEVCEKAHKNRMAINAWIDINDGENIEMYKKLIENGVDVICCNEPLMAKNYIKTYYKECI